LESTSVARQEQEQDLALASPYIAGVLLLVPLIQVLSQPSWVFSPPGWDQWFYHGYFIHLKHHVSSFAGTYYGTRFAWILPGFVAHWLFSPLVANAILRLYVCWIAVLSVYSFARRFYGVRCALIAGLLVCCYPDFLAAAGWDYVDGVAIAYGLLAIEELTAAAVIAKPATAMLRSVFGGMAIAAMIHSHVFLWSVVPAISILFLVRAGMRCVTLVASALTGFVTLTLIFGVISRALGGQFLFFLPSFAAARTLSNAYYDWYAKPEAWINGAWWLVVPSALIVGVIFFLARHISRGNSTGRHKPSMVRMADAGSVVVVGVTFAILHFRALPVMEFPYYADYFTVVLPAVTAALIGRQLDALTRKHFLILSTAGAALALLIGTEVPRFLPGSISAAYLNLRNQPKISPYVLASFLAAGIVTAGYLKRTAARIVAGLAIGFVLFRLGPIRLEAAGSKLNRAAYLSTDRASRELGQLSHDGTLWFWYSYTPGNEHYTSVASTYLWAVSLLNRDLPNTRDMPLSRLHRGAYIAIMNSDAGVHQQAISALARAGVTVEQVQQLRYPVGSFQALITLVRVSRYDHGPAFFTASSTGADLAPGPVLIDYDSATLGSHIDRVLYSPAFPSQERLPPWIIRSTNVMDHAPSAYVPVPAGTSAVHLTFDDARPLEPYGPINLKVQQQGYRDLYQSGTGLGQNSAVIGLAAATEVRIVFLPNEYGYIRLPERVTLQVLSTRAH